MQLIKKKNKNSRNPEEFMNPSRLFPVSVGTGISLKKTNHIVQIFVIFQKTGQYHFSWIAVFCYLYGFSFFLCVCVYIRKHKCTDYKKYTLLEKVFKNI